MIEKSRVDEFVDISRKILRERYGDDPQQSDSYCRLINERRFDALKEFLDNLDSAKIVIGGQHDRKDLYMAPTMVSPIASNESGLMEQEIFGPILPIVPVEDVDEAIRIVNSKATPLALYIFTEDRKTVDKSEYIDPEWKEIMQFMLNIFLHSPGQYSIWRCSRQ